MTAETMPSKTFSQALRIGSREFLWGERTYVMGIINVTPDSFSGDGLGTDVDAALAHALRFQDEGADILDVGGESTRPGHAPVDEDEELRRVIPLIERLAGSATTPISVDTYKASVARRALAAGATMVNDIWGLRRDPEMAGVVAEAGVPVVVMHNQEAPIYKDVVADVMAILRESLRRAEAAGIPREWVIVDPGIGFAKRPEHSLELLRRLGELRALGCPVLVGTSRKSSIGAVLGLPVEERLEGTAATVAIAIANGADIVRVHDVKAMVRVARMSDAIVRGWSPP
ncbi:MAG TPA: dihydropteroate synthase [Dehalococcoidia bacterium]|nr:dihydropteroate synthase [Dehalococcoidia bacterium]